MILRLLLCTLFLPGVLGANDAQYTSPFSHSEIRIDGMADEPVWAISQAMSFSSHDTQPLQAETWFKSAWDEQYLYFYVWMDEDDVLGAMVDRDDHLWHEEVLEIFIDADSNPKTYYEFQWNPLNTVLDLYVLNPGLNRDVIRQWWKWDAEGLLSAVRIDGTLNDSSDIDRGWALEVAIPFDQIQSAPNIPPREGDVWRFDLTRRDGTEKKGTLQKSSWLPPSTHFPLSYGNLVFSRVHR